MDKLMTAWGVSSTIDLHGCDHELLTNPDKLKEFVKKLCDTIEMNPWGETLVERLGVGHLEGFSFFQFIETSNITGHCDEVENRLFLDIFSCKPFDAEKAGSFARDFFKAEKFSVRAFERA